jgi:hypothetical protein
MNQQQPALLFKECYCHYKKIGSHIGFAPFFRTKISSAGRIDKNCVTEMLLSHCEGKSVWIDTSLCYYLKNVIAIIKIIGSHLGFAPFFRTKIASAGRIDKNCVL